MNNVVERVLGTVAMVPKGEYSSEAYYEKLNTVLYNDSTYMAIQPSTGILPTNTDYWQLIGGGVKKENTIIVYNSVADMKADTKLKVGMHVKTNGYYTANDGGGAEYLIKESSSSYYETLTNNLVSELIIENEVNFLQLGAKGDGETDDSDAIISTLEYFTNIEGKNRTYYVTKEFNVENKNLKNIILKVEPYEALVGNTKFRTLTLTGFNNLENVRVDSEFKYTPTINIHAGDISTAGIASNVIAFNIIAGITNLYNCKTNYCWAFIITGTGKANIYNAICNNSEMNFFISSEQDVKVYNSKFSVNKTVNSIYYHHIYAVQRTNTEFNNCDFTENGEGIIGNHYHGYSASINDDYEVSGKMVINNCTLKTSTHAGQLNCVDLFVNGGSIEGALILSGGSFANKPTAYFRNVDITSNYEGNYPIFSNKCEINNCKIDIKSTGTKFLSNICYKIYNSIINCLNGTFHNSTNATLSSPNTNEVVMDNCIVNCDNMTWCYPEYTSDFKIVNSTFNLLTEKTTTNPANRNSTGILYNCIFNNWVLPLDHSSSNTVKYDIISNNAKHTNIS